MRKTDQDIWLEVPLNEEQIHVLQHSLGVDQYGRGRQYRNHFATDIGTTDWPVCIGLCALGLMEDQGKYEMCGGMHIFTVTERGKKEMAKQSPSPPKLTRSQRRYQAFLEADSGLCFSEWLKLKSQRE